MSPMQIWSNEAQERYVLAIRPDSLELFRTIINFLKTKTITLEPFLYICVIASTRRILSTGAEISYMEELTDPVFYRYLMDLGANVLVIMALVVAVYLARRVEPRALA